MANAVISLWNTMLREVGSISNLGARHFAGTFFLKKKGACSKHEKGTSLFIEKSWGARAPSAPPVPTSLTLSP